MKNHYVYYCYRKNSKPNEPHKYIGVRSCICEPIEDIGIKYFTSSTYVKKDIETYGLNNFIWKVIKEFKTRNEAEEYELYLHTKFRVGHDKSYYNINYGQSYDITSHNRKKYEHRKSKEELHLIYSRCQKERFKDLREIYKVCSYGEKNGMWNNGHLISGSKNGNSKPVKITFKNGLVVRFDTKKSACNFFNVDRQFITNILKRGGVFYLTESMNISFVEKMKKYEGMIIEQL